MKKILSTLIFLLSIFSLQGQSYYNMYKDMQVNQIESLLEMKENDELIEMNNSLISFMIEEIENAIKNNYIDFERGINEITFLRQSQRHWINYYQSFAAYVGSAYGGGSMRFSSQRYIEKRRYILRNIELIQEHTRWKMDQ